jgi:DNA-binding transcriptional LysR family regulator
MTAAADELCVTHGAVSRQVRALQEELGVALFEGPKHALQLTPAGQALLPVLTQAFDQIATAVAALSRSKEQVLNVSCLSTFTMRWLIPRLHRFHDMHNVDDLRHGDTRAGNAALTVAPLFEEQLGLVLSPDLLRKLLRGTPAQQLKLLRSCPRLQTRTRPLAWQDWAMACHAQLPAAPQQAFAHYSYTLEAALGGLGLCVAPWHLVAADVANGRLVAPLGFVCSGFHYSAQHHRDHRLASVFCQWLQQQVGAMAPAPHAGSLQAA